MRKQVRKKEYILRNHMARSVTHVGYLKFPKHMDISLFLIFRKEVE